ncbi:MAG: spore coat protein [Eubacteriales bacterium]|nr:spore coat protein [Eubacteriales bacterium]
MNSSQQNWNDQDLLTDILTQEKHLLSVYSTSITESSSDGLRDVLFGNYHAVAGDQLSVFKEMNAKGFYPVKDAPPADICSAVAAADGLAQTLPV